MIDPGTILPCLKRLAHGAGVELLNKEPHWGDAIMADGLTSATRVLGEEARSAAIKWFEPKLSEGPRTDGFFWFWAAEALAALDLYVLTSRPDYLNYGRSVVEAFDSKATHTTDGAIVPHPPALEIWVDVSYFTAPAMALLGRLSGNGALLEGALRQMLVHWRNLLDPDSGLLWHVAYVERRSHSPCLWARGNSWFSIAAPQVIDEIHRAGATERLASGLKTLSGALARQLNAAAVLQDPSGLWHTVIDRPDSYLESSAAAGLALGLGRALRMNLEGLDRDVAQRCYERAIEAICSKVNAQGQFTGVSQQTPPGDFSFYQSIDVGTASFGTGICLIALVEALADKG